jgi:hypothetical protein
VKGLLKREFAGSGGFGSGSMFIIFIIMCIVPRRRVVLSGGVFRKRFPSSVFVNLECVINLEL